MRDVIVFGRTRLYPRVVRQIMVRLLTLIAVLIMPFGMTAAPAAQPEHHAAMPMQHCPNQSSDHSTKNAFAQCTLACSAALPAVLEPSEQRLLIVCAPSKPAAAQILSGLHPETATPPPRRS